MKRYLLTLIITVFTTCRLLAQIPTNGLVGYWPFNGNANDESGNGHNGVVYGAQLTTDRNNSPNKAYEFDGTSMYIQCANANYSFTNAITISLWVEMTTSQTQGAQFLVSKGVDGNTGNFSLNYNNLPYVFYGGFGSGTQNNAISQIVHSPNTGWRHVSMVYDGSNIKLYVNGSLEATTAYVNPMVNIGDLLMFGKQYTPTPNTPPYYTKGKLDDIGIWNRALTQQEISNLYYGTNINPNCNASLPSNITNGLVGYWPFCGNANDESGNGNNGIVSGATLAPDRQGTPNSAYTFNGVNSKITIPDNNVYDNQTYSIGFWYKFSTPSTPGSGGNNVNPGIISRVANSSNVTYDNWMIYEAVTLVGFASGVGGASGVSGTPTGQNNGQWKHVVFSVGADSIRCYVNGIKTSSSLKGGNLTFNNYDIVIGRSNATYWKAFQGDIDDLALWNRALNDQEVFIYYNDCNSPVISAIGTTTFCQGSNVILTLNESYSTYQWQKNNVNINGATSKTYTSNAAGTYRSIVSNSCGIDTSNTISLTSLPNKSNTVLVTGITSFCIGDSVTLNSSNVTAGYSYQWYRNNIAINGATSNAFIGKNPGTYKVVTKNNANGCSRISSNSAIVSVTCRTTNRESFIGNVEPLKDILVYPNPNEGSFTLEIANENIEDGVANFQIMNVTGQVIFNGTANFSNGFLKEEINLERKFNKGLYLVKVKIGDSEMTEKVMLQ